MFLDKIVTKFPFSQFILKTWEGVVSLPGSKNWLAVSMKKIKGRSERAPFTVAPKTPLTKFFWDCNWNFIIAVREVVKFAEVAIVASHHLWYYFNHWPGKRFVVLYGRTWHVEKLVLPMHSNSTSTSCIFLGFDQDSKALMSSKEREKKICHYITIRKWRKCCKSIVTEHRWDWCPLLDNLLSVSHKQQQ